MFVTNWISTTKIQKISEITNFFRHYFLSRTEVISYKNKGQPDLDCPLFLSHESYISIVILFYSYRWILPPEEVILLMISSSDTRF